MTCLCCYLPIDQCTVRRAADEDSIGSLRSERGRLRDALERILLANAADSPVIQEACADVGLTIDDATGEVRWEDM